MTYPQVFTFDYAKFLEQFPEFNDTPEARLEVYWGIATDYISNQNYGYLKNASRQYALNLMTAHLTYNALLIANGQTTVVLTGASVDKVNLSMKPPETPTSFNWWLSSSPYGLELRALLSVKSSGGFYVGGSPEGSAFRKVNGRF